MSDRIAVITGGRDYEPTPIDLRELHTVLECRDIGVVRCGGAAGVDIAIYAHIRDIWARELWPADWKQFGNSAGPKRNKAMLTGDTGLADTDHVETKTRGRSAVLCVAFHGGGGTHNCIVTAKRLGIDVHVIGEGQW